MDLSLIAGLNLTEEQMSAINAASAADVTAATTGLVNKNNELIGEKKTALQNVADNATALEDARKAAVSAEEKRLILTTDMDGLKSHYETQLAESTAAAKLSSEKAQNALLSRDTTDFLTDAMSMIHDSSKWSVKAEVSNMQKVSYNDDGLATVTYERDGKIVANSVAELKTWASTQDDWKTVLKGVDSSGAGVTTNTAGGGRALTLTEQAIAANKAAR